MVARGSQPVLKARDLMVIAKKQQGEMLRRGRSSATVAIYGWGVQTLVKYIGEPDGQVVDRDLIRITAHLIERCDPRLADQMGERPPTLRDLRDRALFHYIMGTGGRVSEILQVHRATFEREVIRQKGGGDKEFICQPGVAGLIHHYLAVRTDDLPWLWIALPPGEPVRRLDPAGVLMIWARLCAAYLVPRFTTHQLRHTAATLLADRGHDPLAIANFLGHVDTRSVQVYAKVSVNRLAAARGDLDVAT